MADARYLSPAPKADWRTRGRSAASTNSKRIWVTLVGLILAGTFVWAVVQLWRQSPRLYLAALPIVNYDAWLPPAPWSSRDAEQYAECGRTLLRASVSPPWLTLQTAEQAPKLLQNIRGLSHSKNSVVMLFVSAHGVADDAEPSLLCSDYQRSGSERWRVSELLDAMSANPAGLKLLILDTGYVQAAPRLAMASDEFLEQLIKAVRSVNDPDLWVLTAADRGEMPHIMHSARRSVFAHVVFEGLLGKALPANNKDNVLHLASFYAFVRSNVANWVAHCTERRESQHPLLLRGGVGVVEKLPQEPLFIARVERRTPAAAEPQKKPGDKPESPPSAEGQGKLAADNGKGGASNDEKRGERSAGGIAAGGPAPQVSGEKAGAQAGAATAAGTNAAAALSPAVAGGANAGGAAAPQVAASPSASDAKGATASTTGAQGKTETQALTPAAGKSGEQPATAGAMPPGERTPPPAVASISAAGSAASGSPTQASEGPLSTSDVRAILARAWAVRDRLQVRTADMPWTPVDYAPHLWRELQEVLLGYELRYRCDTDWNESRLDGLRQIAEERQEDKEAILFRLRQAARQFQSVQEHFADTPEELREVVKAIQLKNELLLAAQEYVRWHRRAIYASSAEQLPVYNEVYNDLCLLLETALPNLCRLLEKFEEPDVSDKAAADDLRPELFKLSKQLKELSELRLRIERGPDGLLNEALLESLLATRHDHPNAAMAECLLATPLLSAPARLKWLDYLAGIEPGTLERPESSDHGATAAPGQVRWERLAEQANLELLLTRLAKGDPKLHGGHDPRNLKTARPADPQDAERWGLQRAIRKDLEAFYRQLPNKVVQGAASETVGDQQTAQRLLRFVEVRDVRSPLVGDLSRIAVRRVAFPALASVALEVTIPPEVRLSRDPTRAWAELAIDCQVRGRACQEARVQLSYENQKITLADAKEQILPASPKNFTVPLVQQAESARPDQRGVLRLKLRAGGDLAWKSAKLQYTVWAGDADKSGDVLIRLPALNRVELVVHRVTDLAGASAIEPTLSQTTCFPTCFPNRATEYQWYLKNHSDAAKKVAVEAWAFTQPKSSDEADVLAKNSWDPGAQPAGVVQLLAKAADVVLPPEGQETRIPLADVKKPAAAKPGAEKAPADKPEAPSTVPRPMVSHGMLCVVREGNAVIGKFPVLFRLAAPSQYVSATLEYMLVNNVPRIEIKVTPRGSILPVISPEEPIRVQWETLDAIDQQAARKTVAQLSGAASEDTLYGNVGSAPRKPIEIRLTVDGYPRAFLFDNDKGERAQISLAEGKREVRVTAPEKGQAYRAPLVDTAGIPVEVEVDAPVDVFHQGGHRDVVEIGFDPELTRSLTAQNVRHRFYSDRLVTLRLDEIGPSGSLKVTSAVSDFKLRLVPTGWENKQIGILAQMNLAGVIVRSDSVPIILDATAPQFRRWDVPARVLLGTDVPVSVSVADDYSAAASAAQSGVVSIAAGFDLNGDQILNKDELNKGDERKGEANTRGQVTLNLPTKDLKAGQSYVVLVQATDRVGWSKTESKQVFIEPPPPPKPPPQAGAALSNIQGRVGASNPNTRLEWTGLIVSIPALGRMADEVHNDGGAFHFKDVPLGKHLITAKGAAGGWNRVGQVEIMLTAEPAKNVFISTETPTPSR